MVNAPVLKTGGEIRGGSNPLFGIHYKERCKVMTSAEANKKLKQLQEKKRQLVEAERKNAWFVAATTEDEERVRENYNYDYYYDVPEIDRVDAEIRELKHQINKFNVSCMIPELGMTIDQVLVYLPQLKEKQHRLAKLADHLPKQRVNDRYGSRSTLIEYEYANYDVADARADYEKVSKLVADVQIALDRVNNSVEI